MSFNKSEIISFKTNDVLDSWMQKLRSNTFGSLYIRLCNLSNKNLVIVPNNEDHCFDASCWIKSFTDLLPSGCSCEAGFQSTDLFSVCSSHVTYACGEKPNQFTWTLYWEFGTYVCRAWAHQTECCSCHCIKYIFMSVHGSVYFYILDVDALPTLNLVSACIKQDSYSYKTEEQSSAKSILPSREEDVLDLKTMTQISVFHEFLTYLRSCRKMPLDSNIISDTRDKVILNEYNSTTLNVADPRNFLDSLQSTNSENSLIRKFLSDSKDLKLYLEWRIGCEIFEEHWSFDKPIHLYTYFPGGYPDKKIVLNSRVDHTSCTHCFALQTIVEIKQQTVSNELLDQKYSSHSTAMQRSILRCLVCCMKHVSYGLDCIISLQMISKYGDKWTKQTSSNLQDHIWEDETRKSLDIEGVIFVLIFRWDEVFESIFTKAGLSFEDIKAIQSYALFWSTQQTSQFTLRWLLSFIQQSIRILTALKQTACAKSIKAVKRIYLPNIDLI